MAKREVSELNQGEITELQSSLKEAVVALGKIQFYKDSLSEIANNAAEMFDIKTSDVTRYAKYMFDTETAMNVLNKADEVHSQCVRLGILKDSDDPR